MKTKESKRACEDEQGSDPYVGIGHSGKGRKNSVKKRKERHWMKFRHRVVRNLAYAILYPYMRLKYGVRIERFREQGKRPYLILMNHQTPFDQFLSVLHSVGRYTMLQARISFPTVCCLP